MNFFAYANGNPVSYLDPSGLGAIGENQNLSWLNTSTTSDGTLFGNNYNLFSTTGTDQSAFPYEAAGTTLGGLSIGNDVAQYSSIGTYFVGVNNASGELSLYATPFYGNQYVTTANIGDVAERLGGPLTVAGIVVDAANPNTSWAQFGANTTVAGTAWGISTFVEGGGPVGAALGGGYFVGGFIQEDVNGAVAGSFQILTDWYYHAPFGPNFADLPNNP
jgi:hypothetical protein